MIMIEFEKSEWHSILSELFKFDDQKLKCNL